jgi:uncharacterized protein
MLDVRSPETWAIFGAIATIAGFVDTLAGGGGLITVPALLLGGIPPLAALGTNKLQGVVGTLVGTLRLAQRGRIPRRAICLPFLAALAGGTCGTLLVQQVDDNSLDWIIPVVLILIASYFLFAPKAGEVERKPRLSEPYFALLVLPWIGFYDGFFGPGTGSFYALSGVSLLGQDLVQATARAKLLNFASSLASLAVFVVAGQVIWPIGLAMIAGQILGALIGAAVVINGGARIIRPVIVGVCAIMLTRYLWHKI